MRVRARCNRRGCQARKTYAKPLALYKKWPTCTVCGVGKMYEDKFRNSGEEHKQRDLCSCDGYDFSIRNGPHERGSPKCKHREEVLLQKAFIRGTFKHSPKTNNTGEEPDF